MDVEEGEVQQARGLDDALESVADEVETGPLARHDVVETRRLRSPKAPGAVIARFGIAIDDKHLAIAQRTVRQMIRETQPRETATGKDEIVLFHL